MCTGPWETSKEGKREIKVGFSPDLLSPPTTFLWYTGVIKIHTPDPLLCADSFFTACSVHLYSKTKRKRRKKQKTYRTCTPTPELKWWCSTCFLSTRESTQRKRGKVREGKKERESERGSKGLTAGWYSWGLAREADGAEWTSPRNFNVGIEQPAVVRDRSLTFKLQSWLFYKLLCV